MLTTESWIAERLQSFDSSEIRKMFDMAAKLRDPINLSIGEPDFPVPPAVKAALIAAIQNDRTSYAPTQGIAPLRARLHQQIAAELGQSDRQLLVTSGTSGGLFLALLATIDPGDEVIVFDPYFVMYDALVRLVGGVVCPVSTYPHFQPDLDRLAAAITPRTKMMIVNSPCNPTGVCWSAATMAAVAELAAEHGICLVSDEIYRDFCYDQPHVRPAAVNPQTLVIDGFSKSHALTGLRLGFAHGPADVIEAMTKLQQFTFVCAPHPVQYAGIAALDTPVAAHLADYRRKRDLLVRELDPRFQLVAPSGAFFAFVQAPWGSGTEFATAAIENNVLVIPGKVFSQRDTHFRISFAVADERLAAGIAILNRLAARQG